MSNLLDETRHFFYEAIFMIKKVHFKNAIFE